MNETKESQNISIEAYRIELSDFKILGFLPMQFRSFLSLSLNTRLSQISYFFSKKQFISKDVAKFQYAIYKEAIVTIDSIYFVLKPKSSELLEANKNEKLEYLKKVSEFLSKYDESPNINAIFETKAGNFNLNNYFSGLDNSLSKQEYITPAWIKTASKLKDKLTIDIEKQVLSVTESTSYFILSVSLTSHQDEQIDNGYKKLIGARNKITENILIESVSPQELVDYATNHYVNNPINEAVKIEIIK